MIELIATYLLVCLTTASGLFFAYKQGLMDLYQAYKKAWMPDRCEPCFSLWLGTLVTIIAVILTDDKVLFLTIPAIPPLAILFYRILQVPTR